MLIVLPTKIQFCKKYLSYKEFLMEKNLKIFGINKVNYIWNHYNFEMNADFVVTQSLKIITVYSK